METPLSLSILVRSSVLHSNSLALSPKYCIPPPSPPLPSPTHILLSKWHPILHIGPMAQANCSALFRTVPPPPSSGFGAEGQQVDEGVEEGLQPALVGHTLLHHLLLTRVFRCLLYTVRLGGIEKENRLFFY